MMRILVKGAWYDPVSGKSIYENEYENSILAQSEDLFPDFKCVRFKALIESEYGRSRPDLALIDHGYRRWYVVEVELDGHPLRSHVEAQVRDFAYGRYDESHVQALMKADETLDEEQLRHMLMGDSPRVLVLVTTDKPDWSSALLQYDCIVGVIELFRDDLDKVILRVAGDQPKTLDEEILSECYPEGMLPNAMRISSPAPLLDKDNLDLLVEGYSTRWRLVRVQDTVWIVPAGRVHIKARIGSSWVITRTVTGDLSLSELETQV